MALESGLKPSIRGYNGIGFGRALPEPFGFSRYYKGDGVNDYFEIKEYLGQTHETIFERDYSIEIWWEGADLNRSFFGVLFTGTSNIYEVFMSSANLVYSYFRTLISSGAWTPLSGSQNQYVITKSGNVINIYLNGYRVTGGTHSEGISETCTAFVIGKRAALNFYTTTKLDEMRLYTSVLSESDVLSSWNSGAGANPIRTEKLELWFDFNKAEADTELYPDGIPIGWTSGNWGIRNKAAQDSWAKKYHAMQLNMTNNENLGGKLILW